MDIEMKLGQYADLSPAERAEVDALVAEHPEYKTTWQEARALAGVLDASRSVVGTEISEATLAHYITLTTTHNPSLPQALQGFIDRIKAQLAEDSALQARYEAQRKRLQAIEAQIPAHTHFEQLTGIRLEEADTAGFEPVSAKAPPRIYALRRWLIAAVLLMATTYGVLFLVSENSVSDLMRLASTASYEAEWRPLEVRGAPPAEGTNDEIFFNAVMALPEIKTSFLGLFPSYRAEKVAAVADQFRTVVERETGHTPLALEARFYLGKLYLAQENVAAARAEFDQVVRGGGNKAADAQAMLDELSGR